MDQSWGRLGGQAPIFVKYKWGLLLIELLVFIPDNLFQLECIDHMPLLSPILHNHQPPPAKLHNLIHLLHWLLVEQSPCLDEVPRTDYDSILSLVSSESTVAKPDFIFQVQYSPHSSIEANWSKLNLTSKRTFNAFHGSRLENFHSIMHFGLQQHFNKVKKMFSRR